MSWTDDDLDLALRDLKNEELPLGATEAVRARVLSEVSKPARRRWWLWALAPVAAAALALVVVVPWRHKRIDSRNAAVVATGESGTLGQKGRGVDERSGRAFSGGSGLPPGGGNRSPAVVVRGRAASPIRTARGLPAHPGNPHKQYRVLSTAQPGLVEIVTPDRSIKVLWDLNTEGDSR